LRIPPIEQLDRDKSGRPIQEAPWEEQEVHKATPACGNLLDALFCDEPKGTYRSVGVSVNFQHEHFSPHVDSWENGGVGDGIATLTLGREGSVSLFSCLSGLTYTFTVEDRSCWWVVCSE
jgi:hypothetical protein